MLRKNQDIPTKYVLSLSVDYTTLQQVNHITSSLIINTLNKIKDIHPTLILATGCMVQATPSIFDDILPCETQ